MLNRNQTAAADAAKGLVTVFSLTNTTRNPLPRVSFAKVAATVMGKNYFLSVVIINPARMRVLNRTYRKKDASTDVLAFPLSKTEGEIYFSVPDIKKKAKAFGMKESDYFKYLYIHALVHLTGLDHGRRMDALEKRHCRRFGFIFPE